MVGNILVSITSEVQSSWQIIVYSGLVNVLFQCLESFSHYQEQNDVSFNTFTQVYRILT